MALFGFGKKKEEENVGCDCGGECEPKTPAKEEDKGCCCGGNCNSETMAAAEIAKKEGSAIKVLGSGCAKCNQLEAATKEALVRLGMEDTIDHVTDFSQIAAYGVMTTPALVVDGKVVSFGKVLKTEDVIKILQKARG
ncbi:MAG TPA: thioredoxin family protein [Mobilitalea sp.]|nr:thioredoxin family protein [Mobilitalea sp.]